MVSAPFCCMPTMPPCVPSPLTVLLIAVLTAQFSMLTVPQQPPMRPPVNCLSVVMVPATLRLRMAAGLSAWSLGSALVVLT